MTNKTNTSNEAIKGGISVFIGGCSFGLLATIVTFAYRKGFTLTDVVGTQTMFGTLILWGLYLIWYLKPKNRSIRNLEQTQKKTFINSPLAVLMAGASSGLTGVFYYNSLIYFPASISIILLMQFLWIGIILELLIFGKRPTKIQILAVVIVILGAVLASGFLYDSGSLNPMGFLFGMLAALSYSILLLASGRVGNQMNIIKKGALITTGGLIIVWLILPPIFLINGVLFGEGLYTWGLSLALLGTIIPPILFSYGVPKTGVALGSILSSSELPIAVLSASIFLSEFVSFSQWLGVIIIILGIILANTTFRKKGPS